MLQDEQNTRILDLSRDEELLAHRQGVVSDGADKQALFTNGAGGCVLEVKAYPHKEMIGVLSADGIAASGHNDFTRRVGRDKMNLVDHPSAYLAQESCSSCVFRWMIGHEGHGDFATFWDKSRNDPVNGAGGSIDRVVVVYGIGGGPAFDDDVRDVRGACLQFVFGVERARDFLGSVPRRLAFAKGQMQWLLLDGRSQGSPARCG